MYQEKKTFGCEEAPAAEWGDDETEGKNYKHLGILKANELEQTEIKKNLNENSSDT